MIGLSSIFQYSHKGLSVSNPPSPKMSRKRIFEQDLPTMMYGFGRCFSLLLRLLFLSPLGAAASHASLAGDVPPEEQDPDTQDVVEELLVDYLRFLAKEGTTVSDGARIGLDDVLFVVRKDTKKYDRVRELVIKNKEIENQKKAFKQQRF